MLASRTPLSSPPARCVLSTEEWSVRAQRHLERVQQWTTPRRERRSRRESHPVYDFLFQYYPYSAGQLELWHPEPHEAVVNTPAARERFHGPEYVVDDTTIQRDARALSPETRVRLVSALHLLVATRDRPANFGCFGMHEWAMVFGGHDVRHADIAPLRLPQVEVDDFIESRPLNCSHFDAFRFFAPAAKPKNRVLLEWSARYDREQPGCIHANMDLYRWAFTAMPWIGSALLWECFELAADLRVLDMQASPYDLRSLGFEPVRVETSDGRDEYQRRQRELSARASVLRERLIDVIGALGLSAESPAAERST